MRGHINDAFFSRNHWRSSRCTRQFTRSFQSRERFDVAHRCAESLDDGAHGGVFGHGATSVLQAFMTLAFALQSEALTLACLEKNFDDCARPEDASRGGFEVAHGARLHAALREKVAWRKRDRES